MTDNINNSSAITGYCDSNSTKWLLVSPVCSLKYSSIITFVTVALLLSIITFVTIFGNFLVLLALYRFKKLRSMSNCLIGNLAVSDLLLALSVLPVSTTYDLLGYWVFGEIMCTIWLCIDVLYCTASIWGLCTIAVDRYTATVYPVWYHERKSPTRALVYIIFVWMFSIIVSVAPFIGWRDMIPSFFIYAPDINRQECILFMSKSYVVYSAMGSFVIPTCLMVFLYVRIFIVLKKRTRSMQPMRKRVLYPSESDYENDSHGNEDGDSEEKTDVELRAASTQTTPVNCKTPSKAENGTRAKTTKPSKNSMENQKLLAENKRGKLDHQNNEHNDVDYNNKIPQLTIEITDHTDGKCVNNTLPPETLHNNDLKSNCKQKNCNLTVDYDQNKQVKTNTRPAKSPSKKSIKSNDEQHLEVDTDSKYVQKSRSNKAIFFPWKRGISGSMTVKHKYELREQRATKRMAMIMACFCFCWWPFLFMYTIRSFCENCPLDTHFQAFIIWLGYANSSLNPILYTIFNDDFRKAFHKIVFCKGTSTRRPRYDR